MGGRILVVEDDPLIASHLETLLEEALAVVVVTGASIVEAVEALRSPVDFALLDVDVVDGKTYGLAQLLDRLGVPVAFLSASDHDAVPEALRNIPFVKKPCPDPEVVRLVSAREHRPSG